MDLLPWMQEWHMLPAKGGTILCAVSGGRDSVCLLHYLHALGKEQGFTVAAGHYNHHMRPTAQRDEDFVRELCAELGVAFYTDGRPVVEEARARGLGVEETGRDLRYAFLAQTADAIGAERIATAHHQNDQAETVLLNLLRGTGPEGLRGIPPVRGRLIRPLLDTPREEIEAYLRENGLGCVEDETNESQAFTRNRLRRQVLPALAQINPAWQRNIARTAAIVGREDRYLETLARDQMLPPSGAPGLWTGPDREGTLSAEGLCRAPEALQPRIVRQALERWGVGRKDITAAHLSAVLTLARRCREGSTSLPGGSVVCSGGTLSWHRLPGKQPDQTVLAEGRTRWGAWDITVRRGEIHSTGETFCLRFDPDRDTLSIGPCRLSERLTLPGSRGGRSIKRLLADRGVPQLQRQDLPVLRMNGTPAAVPGVGTDERFTPQRGEEIITIIMKRN